MKEIKNAAINSYKALYEQDIKELKMRIAELEQINEQHRMLNGRLRTRVKALEAYLSKIQKLLYEIDGDDKEDIDGD
jgi:ppGpp synthetase/RelA/SpoT-type nucleotidyltranferase